MSYYHAIRLLMPICLGDISETDIMVEGALLDVAAAGITSLLPEFFPSTIEVLLRRWEAEYGIIPRQGVGIDDRRRAVHAAYVNIGTRAHFITALAAALGYIVTITEGGEEYIPFRAASAIWIWTVTTQNKPPVADIRNLFADLSPPHMRLVFA